MRSQVRPIILFALAFVSACAPYSNRQDVIKDTPQSILANLDSVPPGLLQDALDTILAAPNPKGETYAMEASRRRQFQDPVSQNKILVRLLAGESAESRDFVMALVKSKPDLITPQVVELLIKRDFPGTPDILFGAVKTRPGLLTQPVAQYFISKRYAPFIPMIAASIEKGENVEQNLKILSGMNTAESNNALLELAGKDTAVRPSVLRVLPEIKEPEARQRAETILEQTWKNNEPGPLRTTALEGYASIRGVDAGELDRDRTFPMADAQGDLAVNALADRAQIEQKVQPTNRNIPQPTQPAKPVTPAEHRPLDKTESKDKKRNAEG